MGDIIGMIKELAASVGSYFGWAKQRDAEKNAAPVVAAKVAQQEQAQQDKTNAAIQSQDADELRKELAE